MPCFPLVQISHIRDTALTHRSSLVEAPVKRPMQPHALPVFSHAGQGHHANVWDPVPPGIICSRVVHCLSPPPGEPARHRPVPGEPCQLQLGAEVIGCLHGGPLSWGPWGTGMGAGLRLMLYSASLDLQPPPSPPPECVPSSPGSFSSESDPFSLACHTILRTGLGWVRSGGSIRAPPQLLLPDPRRSAVQVRYSIVPCRVGERMSVLGEAYRNRSEEWTWPPSPDA